MKRAVATTAIALMAFTGLMGVVSAQEKKDEGPAKIDVSKYSPEMQKAYQVFAKKCGSCHTLARAINADYALADEWERDITTMMQKAGKLISPDERKQIYEFVVYDSKIRKADLYERKLADASQGADLTPSQVVAP